MNGNWRKWKINEIQRTDPLFPKELIKIKNCPERLFYRGVWNEVLFSKTLSIVGSRRMTKYGQVVVEKFMPDFVQNGITIVSGFMYGIDAFAHKMCLEMGGKTIAILGGGLNVLTPSENDDLYTEILKNDGLVISEYEPDFKPTLWSFPQRNRIVSGLSTMGTLVVEAGIKSGSLVTADLAIKQKKKVFAVPGPITSSASDGTNWLIEQNLAKITIGAKSILGDKVNSKQMSFLIDPGYKEILEVLHREAVTVDELARIIKKTIPETSVLISQMMMDGLVEDEAGKLYAL